jgi:hypothetical protein
MKLQTARQGKNENPQAFRDRCRALSQKIIRKVEDPLVQRIHNKNAERMLLASFVAGLTGVPGRQVRYSNPETLEHALQIALAVQEAKSNRGSMRVSTSISTIRLGYGRTPPVQRGTQAANRVDQLMQCVRSVTSRVSIGRRRVALNSQRPASTRNAQNKADVSCYECEGIGHFARECPTRLNKGVNSTYPPGGRNPSEHSRRSSFPSEGPSHRAEKGDRKKPRIRETGKRCERRELFSPPHL